MSMKEQDLIRKLGNHKEIPTKKTGVGKTKLTIRYLYFEKISYAE